MALRSLAGKLKVLTGRAAPAPHPALASEFDKACRERLKLASSVEEKAKEIMKRLIEARLRREESLRKGYKVAALTAATGVGFVAFFGSCVVDVLADDEA